MPEPASAAKRNALTAVNSWHMHAFEAGFLTRIVQAHWLLARCTIKSTWTPLETSAALIVRKSILLLFEVRVELVQCNVI